MNISEEQLNVNNERIEELALKRFPIVDTPYGCDGHLHQLKFNKEFSRDGYIVGYKDCLHFKFEEMTVLIDWLKRFKSRSYFEQNSPFDIVCDFKKAIKQDYNIEE